MESLGTANSSCKKANNRFCDVDFKLEKSLVNRDTVIFWMCMEWGIGGSVAAY